VAAGIGVAAGAGAGAGVAAVSCASAVPEHNTKAANTANIVLRIEASWDHSPSFPVSGPVTILNP
jgi:hypothetical protein